MPPRSVRRQRAYAWALHGAMELAPHDFADLPAVEVDMARLLRPAPAVRHGEVGRGELMAMPVEEMVRGFLIAVRALLQGAADDRRAIIIPSSPNCAIAALATRIAGKHLDQMAADAPGGHADMAAAEDDHHVALMHVPRRNRQAPVPEGIRHEAARAANARLGEARIHEEA